MMSLLVLSCLKHDIEKSRFKRYPLLLTVVPIVYHVFAKQRIIVLQLVQMLLLSKVSKNQREQKEVTIGSLTQREITSLIK